ncbi:MAG TPA: response regulator [Chitinophagaceae bacterium]
MTRYNDKAGSALNTTHLHNETKKRALIVDDETDICYLLSSILKQKNIQTTFAGSLAEADRILQSSDFIYYVFLDNHLPDGLGINQIKRWKEKFPFIHLIMITAHDSYEERKQASKDGADDFIAKPFSKEIIFNSIVPTSA